MVTVVRSLEPSALYQLFGLLPQSGGEIPQEQLIWSLGLVDESYSEVLPGGWDAGSWVGTELGCWSML